MKIFCERFKELRQESKINSCTLAKILNVSQATISRWENGVVLPDIEDLYNIAIYFKVTPNYLLGFED